MTRREFSVLIGAALQAQNAKEDLASLSLAQAAERIASKKGDQPRAHRSLPQPH